MLEIKRPDGGGGGGGWFPGRYFGFKVAGMIEWGQKSKPKNIPEPKFNPKKYFHADFPSHKSFQKA